MSREKALNRSHALALILSVLRDAPRHGYEIAREVERRSGKRLTFREGTLYPLLHGLEKDEMIAGEWQEREGEKPRRIYVICEAGLAELDRQIGLWRDFSSAVESVIEGESAWNAFRRKLAPKLLLRGR